MDSRLPRLARVRDTPADPGSRTRTVNLLGSPIEFCRNYISTAHYTKWTFLPKNLFEQFSKPANVWFLLLSILQTIPGVSTTMGTPTILFPLVLILVANGLKDIIEDYRRHMSDREENERQTKCRTAANREVTSAVKWGEVQVGSLIVIRTNEFVPADIVLLASAAQDGQVFIETANLDGETNLKTKQSLAPKLLKRARKISKRLSAGSRTSHGPFDESEVEAVLDTVCQLTAYVDCDAPNEFIYNFVGTMHATEGCLGESKERLPLDPDNIALRGCKLKNVPWALGLVIYTGKETKIMMNSTKKSHRKVSHLEYDVGRLTLVVFLLQNILCLIAAIVSAIVNTSEEYLRLSYLGLRKDDGSYDPWYYVIVIRYLTFLILFSNFIPISLLVSMAFVKLVQVSFFQADATMHYVATDASTITCMPRTSDLNEELGQVEYVFSDKTGTLTRNVMDFRKFWVNGKSYGNGMTEIRRCVLKRMGRSISQASLRPAKVCPDASSLPDVSLDVPRTLHVDLESPELWSLLRERTGDQYEAVRRFLMHLAINHDVSIEPADSKSDEIYTAASPDESALCYGARHFGYMFESREGDTISVKLADGSMLQARVHVLLKFNSSRKRSSVIVELAERGTFSASTVDESRGLGRQSIEEVPQLLLYTKGADNVILERLSEAQRNSPQTREAIQTLQEMSQDGLRTLCFAGRYLSFTEYERWLAKYDEAATATENRQDRLDAVAEEIERNLELHGITGIEDRLQDGVGETVEKMFAAGIKVWVLTGDKVETAINIGIATGLLDPPMSLEEVKDQSQSLPHERLKLVASDFEMDGELNAQAIGQTLEGFASQAVREDSSQSVEVATGFVDRLLNMLRDSGGGERSQRPLVFEGLVIDGRCLEVAMMPENATNFVNVTRVCRTVICCRVSPKQKGAIVMLIKEQEKAITLAIGDGANDCNMIQSAHVGVGIRGLEGLQAFNVCDYGIGQFRFLQQLLFVHGRWCYRRIAILVNYTFYKNIVVCMPQYFLGFVSGFSGQKLFNDLLYQAYNVIYTLLPILFFGVLDQDVSRETSMRRTELYELGVRRTYLNPKVSAGWILGGLWHAAIIFVVPYCVMSNGNVSHFDGKANDIWLVGSVIYMLVILVVNLVVLLETGLFNWITCLGIFLSYLGWFLSQGVLSGLLSNSKVSTELHGTMARIWGCPTTYIVIIVVLGFTVLIDLQLQALKRLWFPTVLHKVQQERHLLEQTLGRAEDAPAKASLLR